MSRSFRYPSVIEVCRCGHEAAMRPSTWRPSQRDLVVASLLRVPEPGALWAASTLDRRPERR